MMRKCSSVKRLFSALGAAGRPAGESVKMRFVSDGVGIAQRNGYRDVLVVQQLLNMNLGLLNRHHYLPLHPIDETGMFDRPTSELLRAYCRSVDPCGPTVIDAPAWATEIMHAVRMPGRANAGKSDAMGISRSGRFVGDLAAVSTTLLSLIRGALAWQSEYPAALADPALAALDANRIANFCQFRTVCQMRQSHELLALLKAVAPSISRSKLGPADAIARSVALAMALADIVSPCAKRPFLRRLRPRVLASKRFANTRRVTNMKIGQTCTMYCRAMGGALPGVDTSS